MRVWKMIGKHQGPLGTTIIYGAEGCAYEIQSRKRHILHAASILGSARSPSRKRQGSTAGRNLLSNSERGSEFGRNDCRTFELRRLRRSEGSAAGSDEVVKELLRLQAAKDYVDRLEAET